MIFPVSFSETGMDNDAGTIVEEELTIGCGRKMGSDYHVKVKQICGRQCLSRRLLMIYILKIF
jgi:hypothetical protein